MSLRRTDRPGDASPPKRLTFRRRGLALAWAGALVAYGLISGGTAIAATGSARYVDCSAGSDSNGGTSTAQPWRTIGKANSAALQPGDSLLFKRGCGWTGPLNARWSGTAAAPITIGSYGSGALPRIENAHDDVVITGSHLIIQEILTRANPPGYDSGCNNQPMGWIAGFRFMSGAAFDTLRNSQATGLNQGVLLGSGSHDNRVVNNVFTNNNVKDSDPNSDGGAVAVVVMGDNNDIGYNTISGSDACSRQHVRDGSAVELFGGRNNTIDHNIATQNNNFVEVGNSRSADNTLAYNVVTSTLTLANFVVARGAGDKAWGPTLRTSVYNNSVYLTGSQSFAVECYLGCDATVMTFKNNIVWAQDRVGYVDSTWIEGNNVWWSPGGPKIWFTKSATSKIADPRYVNAPAGDLHLATGSPAIDAGSNDALARGFNVDLDGMTVPQGAGVDIGAYEKAGAQSSAPIASDSFSRTTSNGWGTATKGGGWTEASGSSSDYSVDGAHGVEGLPDSGGLRQEFLNGLNARDVDILARVATNVAPKGASEFAYVVGRRVNATTEYRAKVEIQSSGAVLVQGTRVVGNAESAVTGEVSAGNIYAAGGFIWVRAQFVGANPTTIRIKAWKDGTAEPGWQSTGTDAASGLQQAGFVGFEAYVSSSAAPSAVQFRFDDLTVSSP